MTMAGSSPARSSSCPGTCSAGRALRCRSGRTAHCERVRRYAMFGLPLGGDFGGLFSDAVRVPWGATRADPAAGRGGIPVPRPRRATISPMRIEPLRRG